MGRVKGKAQLTKKDQDELLSMFFFGYPKRLIRKRFEEKGIELAERTYEHYQKRAKDIEEEANKRAVERWQGTLYEKYFSQREVRLDILTEQLEKALAFEIEPGNTLDFQRITREIRDTLKHIATELHEWRTGDTYNIVITTMEPVFGALALWATRHVPAGEPRELALEDLRNITGRFLKELPSGQEIRGTAKSIDLGKKAGADS